MRLKTLVFTDFRYQEQQHLSSSLDSSDKGKEASSFTFRRWENEKIRLIHWFL